MNIKKSVREANGFTLIEILLVVAAIGILAGIVILAINPAKQLGQTRNAQRKSDVNTILNGVYEYVTASEKYLTAIPSDPTGVTATSTGYNISKSVNGRITIAAPSAEQSAIITVTR